MHPYTDICASMHTHAQWMHECTHTPLYPPPHPHSHDSTTSQMKSVHTQHNPLPQTCLIRWRLYGDLWLLFSRCDRRGEGGGLHLAAVASPAPGVEAHGKVRAGGRPTPSKDESKLSSSGSCYTPSGQKGPSVSACSGHTLMEKLLHTQRTERTVSVSVFRTYIDGKTATHPEDRKDCQCQCVQDIHWWKNCYTPRGQKGLSVSVCSGHTLMEKLLHTQRTERTISVSVFRTYIDGKLIHTQRTERTVSVHVFWTYTDGKTDTHPEDRKDCQCQCVQDVHWWRNCYTSRGQKGLSVSVCSGYIVKEKLRPQVIYF